MTLKYRVIPCLDVKDGRVVKGVNFVDLIDAGTTTAGLATVLPADPELTIITGSMPIAMAASQRCPGPVQLVGGRVRGLTQTTVGGQTVAELGALRADVAFIGTNGLTTSHGASTPDAEEAAVKRAIVSAARRIVLLTDSTKFGVEYLRSFASLADIERLVQPDCAVLEGAISGRALYDGRLDPAEALATLRGAAS